MEKIVKLIRFDWAIKNILRDKSNFVILEGFLSELLKQDIKIIELLESESNQEKKIEKLNRVDLLVKLESGCHVDSRFCYSDEDRLDQYLLGDDHSGGLECVRHLLDSAVYAGSYLERADGCGAHRWLSRIRHLLEDCIADCSPRFSRLGCDDLDRLLE